MLIFDAIVAGLIIHYWGEQAIAVLGLVAIIAFLRLSGRLSAFLNVIDASIEIELENEEEEN